MRSKLYTAQQKCTLFLSHLWYIFLLRNKIITHYTIFFSVGKHSSTLVYICFMAAALNVTVVAFVRVYKMVLRFLDVFFSNLYIHSKYYTLVCIYKYYPQSRKRRSTKLHQILFETCHILEECCNHGLSPQYPR